MVYLVGAGLGNPELITLKGIECIKKADVIVYDRLANPSLLNYAKDGCTLIYAGKAAGNHHMPQEEINRTLVRYGRDKTVVRLKGGDSFVFGRGSEEIEELVKNEIHCEPVPGISSSYGAAEYAGIPVTHRDIASSFHVITGHEKSGGNPVDYAALSRLGGTLVFLMGLGAADVIAEKLIQNGKNPETKAAIISGASGEKQKHRTGTLKTLPILAEGMSSPAVIVIGDVVRAQREWFMPKGKKILTTGTKQMNVRIKKAFGDTSVTEISLIKTVRINYDKFKNADLTAFSHIAFTSAGGVDIFFDYLKKSKQDIRIFSGTKFAAAGAKTAEALSEKGIIADIVPQRHTGAALAETLGAEKCENVLLIRAENGATGLPEGLKTQNIPYVSLPLYRTETDYSKKELLNLTVPETDYIILSSGSAAKAYAELSDSLTNARFVAIGSETARAAAEYGITIYKTAAHASAEGIAEAISDAGF